MSALAVLPALPVMPALYMMPVLPALPVLPVLNKLHLRLRCQRQHYSMADRGPKQLPTPEVLPRQQSSCR